MHRCAVGIPEEIEAPAPSKTENFRELSTDMTRINASGAIVILENFFEKGMQVLCIAIPAIVKRSGRIRYCFMTQSVSIPPPALAPVERFIEAMNR
jgi:hypothetical protein